MGHTWALPTLKYHRAITVKLWHLLPPETTSRISLLPDDGRALRLTALPPVGSPTAATLFLPTCSPERCRQEAPSSTHWPQGPRGSCLRGWGGSGHSSSPAGLGRTMWRKGEGEGVDEMDMPCAVGSITVGSLPQPHSRWCSQVRG